MEINIPSKKIYRILFLTIIFLVLCSVTGQIYIYFYGGHDRYLVRLFNLDLEYNVPTLYQSMTLLLCSVLLFIIAISKKRISDEFYYRWLTLAIIFFLMSADELLQFHEKLNRPVSALLNLGGIFHFAWIIPAAIFLIVLGIFYLKFLLNLPLKYRYLFLIAGGVYLLGTIGFEMIGGYIRQIYTEKSLNYALSTNVEETLEMGGILIFIYSLLDYIQINIHIVKINFSKSLTENINEAEQTAINPREYHKPESINMN